MYVQRDTCKRFPHERALSPRLARKERSKGIDGYVGDAAYSINVTSQDHGKVV